MKSLQVEPMIWSLNLEPAELTLLLYFLFQTQNGKRRFQTRSKNTFTKLKIPRTRYFAAIKMLKSLRIIETTQEQGENLEISILPVFEWGALPEAVQRKGTRV